MARDRDGRGTRYVDDDYRRDEERRHRRLHKSHDRDHDDRRHKSRDHSDGQRKSRDHSDGRRKSRDHDDEARRERRERRRAEEARRQAEIDADDSRARRESYYSRPDSDRRSRRMTHDARMEPAKEKSRSSHRELKRDGSRRVKRKEVLVEDRGDDFVYGRPKSMGVLDELPVRRSSLLKRSEGGGSSSRTAYTPRSGSGSTSGRRIEVSKLSRHTSTRESSRGFLSSRPSDRRTSTTKTPPPPTPISRTQSTKEPSRRGGILSSFFRPPQPRTPVPAPHKEVPRVDCLVCMNDNLPVNKTAKLACGHRMCHSCLKRQFSLSVQDPQHMPPRCCTTDHIPLKYADRLFDDKFKKLWNKKYQEYTTANRLYCPAKGCGQWIKPSRIRTDLTYGRKYARCGSCQTKVCVLCSSKFHTRRECPKDEDTNRLVEMAKEKGWQRCYSCKAVVELKEGCNHMTCRCTAQFCMVCAAPWKTCNCPWFNYQHVEDDDRLNHARVPYVAGDHEVVEVIEFPEEPSPPLARRPSTRTRHRREPSRDVDRTDQVLAAHLQSQMRHEPRAPASESRRGSPAVQVYGLGNAGGHHMNESYTMRSVPAPAPRTSSRQSAPRTSFFGLRLHAPAPARQPTQATASAMAGLSRDGKKIGANRVGTWLTHIQVDPEAINTAPRGVEVDDWRCDGTMIGID